AAGRGNRLGAPALRPGVAAGPPGPAVHRRERPRPRPGRSPHLPRPQRPAAAHHQQLAGHPGRRHRGRHQRRAGGDPPGGGLRPDPRPRGGGHRLVGPGAGRPVGRRGGPGRAPRPVHRPPHPHTPALGRRARLLAHPVPVAGRGPLVVVVGASTEAVFRGRERLALILAILSPLLGAILSAGGWLLAGAALRPVRRMSQEADAISLAQAGRRLPYPEGEDEIAQLGRTLNAMLDRIEAAFARERMFLDDASHELRTPISVLRAELEVALLESGDRAALERSLRSALEEAERLAHLAEDLLVLARASAGRLPLRRRPVDVRALAEQ